MEALGEYGIIRTPWMCEFYGRTTAHPCSEHMVPDTPKCPKGYGICCYFCVLNQSCCDRCEFLTPTEDDFKR